MAAAALICFPLKLKLLICYAPPLICNLSGEFTMSKVCQVTGKKPVRGYKYAIRGIAKKKKGIGLKVTGKTKRRFRPNLVKKRLWLGSENRFVTLRLTTGALRTIDKKGIEEVVRDIRAKGVEV
jgi:large subunit ribosomal protein L28